MRLPFIVALGRQQTCGLMAKLRAWVSKFPAVSAYEADTAHTTIGSLFLFDG